MKPDISIHLGDLIYISNQLRLMFECLNLNSLLVKCQIDNPSPGDYVSLVLRKLLLLKFLS